MATPAITAAKRGEDDKVGALDGVFDRAQSLPSGAGDYLGDTASLDGDSFNRSRSYSPEAVDVVESFEGQLFMPVESLRLGRMRRIQQRGRRHHLLGPRSSHPQPTHRI